LVVFRKGAGVEHCDDSADALKDGNQGIGRSNKLSPSQVKLRADASAGISLLAEAHPQCFAVYEARRRPLKVGIHNDLLDKLAGAMSAQEIGLALRFYTGNAAYLRRMLAGAWRYDLDGKPAGSITAEEAQAAKLILAAKRKPKPPPPPAPRTDKKRLGLADLKAAALRRREGAS
jgi:sRNA-binding protein